MFIRRTIPVLALLLAGTPALAAKGDRQTVGKGQGQGQVLPAGTITVRGQGLVKVRPDGIVHINFSHKGATTGAAQQGNTQAVEAFYTQLFRVFPQLKATQVRRQAPSVHESWQQNAEGKWVISGYEANQSVRIKLPSQARDNTLLGQVFAYATEQLGGDYVQQFTEVSERRRQGAERRAAVKAVAAAKKQATLEAGAVGAKLLGVADIGLEEDNGGGGYRGARAFGLEAAMDAPAAAPNGPRIDIDAQPIQASRVVKFFIGQ